MSDDIILKAVHISKQYRLGLVGTGTLSHDLNRLWHKIRGKEDPYLTVGAVNDRSATASSDYVWALQDINFEVKRGEILGIIGKNGAGKSTLLKILSRVTSPTTGSIKSKGRIASLLEVGTGMHPELTGKENIYLNGAILGMTKAEIGSKIDEIIEFSGCQMYIDTPVKRYSSGMRVRLGFAVAAFLEPDILVVDEVLAVGDAEFQQKAIGKMQDISNTTGRTVLFVSHNMAAVRKLCTRGLVLEDGKISFDGDIQHCVDYYLDLGKLNAKTFDFTNRKMNSKGVYISDFGILNSKHERVTDIEIDERICFKLFIQSSLEENITCRITVFDAFEIRILAFDSKNTQQKFKLKTGKNIISCYLENGLEVKPGKYYINISINNRTDLLDHIISVREFQIIESDYYKSGRLVKKDIPLILKKNSWLQS